ncbi:NAD(P)/FAD-dependent oxidoreductase [bacterium]|nr:NAD(P)/FAD-dependent oxidoreductase [bacterium]
MSAMTDEEVIVVGAGPAGIAAAIQLKHSDVNPLVFEKERIGGLLRSANFIENYPGFPEGIKGRCLAERFEQQFKKYKIRVLKEEVKIADYSSGLFSIGSPSGKRRTKYLVLASGTTPSENFDVAISGAASKRVHYNVEEILNLYGKRIVIVGAGDAAFDYAVTLSSENDVLILGRSKSPRCLLVLYKRVLANKKIYYFREVEIGKVDIKNGELLLKLKKEKSMKANLPKGFEDKDGITADHLLFAIGRKPRLDFLSERIERKMAFLESERRLFLAGDVGNLLYRQVAISVGDGLRAAMEIAERIHV